MTFDHNRILSQQVNPHMKLILELLWLQCFQTLTLVHLNGPMPPQENRCIQEVIIWILYFFSPLSSLTWILDNVKSPFRFQWKMHSIFLLARWPMASNGQGSSGLLQNVNITNTQSTKQVTNKVSCPWLTKKKWQILFFLFDMVRISCLEELQVERERNTTYELLYPLFSAKLTAY